MEREPERGTHLRDYVPLLAIIVGITLGAGALQWPLGQWGEGTFMRQFMGLFLVFAGGSINFAARGKAPSFTKSGR